LETKCDIILDNGAITASHLNIKGTVPGITEEKFKEVAEDARANCIVSKSYNLEITMEASLES